MIGSYSVSAKAPLASYSIVRQGLYELPRRVHDSLVSTIGGGEGNVKHEYGYEKKIMIE